MKQELYTVEGRQFRTQIDYARAKRDKELLDKIRAQTNFKDRRELERLRGELRSGKYKFLTILGQDFLEEVEAALKGAGSASGGRNSRTGRSARSSVDVRTGRAGVRASAQGGQRRTSSRPSDKKDNRQLDLYVEKELRFRERRRKLILALCSVIALSCLGYVGVYTYFEYRTQNTYRQLSKLKENSAVTSPPAAAATPEGPLYTLDDNSPPEREVLEEYKKLLNKNKKLIGWLKIDDTNIDYPVMQTANNEYYLDHNFNQEYDKNGSIFMDAACDVVHRNTNLIIYGHHMKSGKMFGNLNSYSSKEYCEKHSTIRFDTIYEKGLYQVMYVFRSRIYNEDEIVFKYYKFFDAASEKEFQSNMQEMAALSLYDTGVTASFGDELLTLSTCDSSETDGRFVVVAKRIRPE